MRTCSLAAIPAAAALALLAGCGTTAGTPAPATAPGPATSAAAPATSASATPAPEPERDGSVRLPWPAAGAADAAALQAGVDRGSQPWLLDPAEVAVSYAAAAHGWNGAQATPAPAGSGPTTVDVRSTDGRRLSLTLTQPARTGRGGIWVVTAERPA